MNIKKVSERFQVPAPTLRYWEELGLIPPVPRNKSGYRNYGDKEIKWVLFILAMRRAGMSLASLRQLVDLYRHHHDDRQAQKALLQQQYDKLKAQRDEINKTLSYLGYKIDHFQDHYIPFLDEEDYYQHAAKKLEAKLVGEHDHQPTDNNSKG